MRCTLVCHPSENVWVENEIFLPITNQLNVLRSIHTNWTPTRQNTCRVFFPPFFAFTYLSEIIIKIRSTTVRNETNEQHQVLKFKTFFLGKTPRKPFTHTRHTLANCTLVYLLFVVCDDIHRTNECVSHDANFFVFFFFGSALNWQICFIFQSVVNWLFSVFSGHETKLEYVYLLVRRANRLPN